MRKPSLSKTREVLSVVALALGIILMASTLIAGALGVTMLARAGSALSQVGTAPAELPAEPPAPLGEPTGQAETPVAPTGDQRPPYCGEIAADDPGMPAECK